MIGDKVLVFLVVFTLFQSFSYGNNVPSSTETEPEEDGYELLKTLKDSVTYIGDWTYQAVDSLKHSEMYVRASEVADSVARKTRKTLEEIKDIWDDHADLESSSPENGIDSMEQFRKEKDK